MTRASIVVEKLGIPTVTLCCDGFKTAGSFTAKGEGYPNLPFATHPGHVNTTPNEQVYDNAVNVMLEQVIKGLTVQPKDAKPKREPGRTDVIFSGTFEEVNDYFMAKEWSEGLPIVPPTVEKVEEFMKFTTRDPDEVLGVLKPDNRKATIWSVAVNGVMSGCRPEYMPVLIAITEAMCDPNFTQENLGHTPATECMIILSGPIGEQLGFNYTQGALRPGFQANTSVGRFWRMYLRNVAGFLPHKTDKGCYGDNFRIVLCENDEYMEKIGWQPYRVDRGFKKEDSVITVMSLTERTQAIECGWPTAEGILTAIEKRMADNHMFIQFFFRGQAMKPLVVITPTIVDSLLREGYTKEMVKEHFFKGAKMRLWNLSNRLAERFVIGVNDGNWPEFIGSKESYGDFKVNTNGQLEFYDANGNLTDMGEERFIQMMADPDDFQLVISGDPARDHAIIGAQNGFIGRPTSKKIELPANWDELLKQRK